MLMTLWSRNLLQKGLLNSSLTMQPVSSEDRKWRKKCIRMRLNRLRINIACFSLLLYLQVRWGRLQETPSGIWRQQLQDGRMISHSNWKCTDWQRPASSPDSDTGGRRGWRVLRSAWHAFRVLEYTRIKKLLWSLLTAAWRIVKLRNGLEWLW